MAGPLEGCCSSSIAGLAQNTIFFVLMTGLRMNIELWSVKSNQSTLIIISPIICSFLIYLLLLLLLLLLNKRQLPAYLIFFVFVFLLLFFPQISVAFVDLPSCSGDDKVNLQAQTELEPLHLKGK